jgi:hypothetical protein
MTDVQLERLRRSVEAVEQYLGSPGVWAWKGMMDNYRRDKARLVSEMARRGVPMLCWECAC